MTEDSRLEAVAEALFNAIWESDEAWELATNAQMEDTRRWAQAAIDALQLTQEQFTDPERPQLQYTRWVTRFELNE